MKEMPFRKLWENELAGELGTAKAKELISRIQTKYIELCAGHPNESNSVLKKILYGNIFPQIAAYQVFLEYGTVSGDREERALSKTLNLHLVTLLEQKKQYEMLCKLPFVFPLMRKLVVFMNKYVHPPAGWTIEPLQNGKNCICMKVHRCFYQEIVKQYGIPQLISIYCKGDDYVFAGAPSAYIVWGRKNSLGTGSDYCDILFYKNMNSQDSK